MVKNGTVLDEPASLQTVLADHGLEVLPPLRMPPHLLTLMFGLNQQIDALRAQQRAYLDGWLIGQGVDIERCTATAHFDTGLVELT